GDGFEPIGENVVGGGPTHPDIVQIELRIGVGQGVHSNQYRAQSPAVLFHVVRAAFKVAHAVDGEIVAARIQVIRPFHQVGTAVRPAETGDGYELAVAAGIGDVGGTVRKQPQAAEQLFRGLRFAQMHGEASALDR